VNILDLARQISDELALTRPVTLFGSHNEGDTTDIKFRVAFTKVINHLAGAYAWGVLKERVQLQASVGVPLPMPTDFKRLVPDTIYDVGARRLLVPVSPSQHTQMLRYPGIGLWRFYLTGKVMRFAPTYAPLVSFEYVTKNVGTNAVGAKIMAFTADSDTPIFDDDLMLRGLAWSMRENERLDSASEFQLFQHTIADAIKMDNGGNVVRSMATNTLLEPPLPTVTGWQF